MELLQNNLSGGNRISCSKSSGDCAGSQSVEKPMDMLVKYSQACARTAWCVGITRLRRRKYLSSPPDDCLWDCPGSTEAGKAKLHKLSVSGLSCLGGGVAGARRTSISNH